MKDISYRKILFLLSYGFILLFIVVYFDSLKSGFYNMIHICTPFFLGMTIAFILNKPTDFFSVLYGKFIKKESIAHSLAITTSYILFILLLIGLFLFIVPQLMSNVTIFFSNLSQYVENLEAISTNLLAQIQVSNIDISHILGEIGDFIKSTTQMILSWIAGSVPKLVSFTSGLVSSLFTLIISFVVSINILAGKKNLLSQGKRICFVYLPKHWATRLEYIFRLSANTFTKYLIGQLTEACILGLLCYIGMNIFKFEYSILISTVVAITALIPVVGAYIGAGVAFVLLAMISPLKALLFIVYFCVLQQLENSIIYPRVVGSSIGLPGLWVIFAVTVGGGLLGLPGILLSVPIMSIIYTLIKEDVHEKYSADSF